MVHHPGAGRRTRCCPGTTSTPAWTSDWLWQDWQDALASEQDDCRWTPCFDCGVCPPGHRDPDRSDRRSCSRCPPSRPRAGGPDGRQRTPEPRDRSPRSSAPDPVRKAWSAALLPRTGTSRGPSSGRCAAPASRSPTRRVLPAPEDLVRQLRPRPGWPARRSTWRSALGGACDPALRAGSDAGAVPGPGRARGRRGATPASLVDRIEASGGGSRSRGAAPTSSRPRGSGSRTRRPCRSSG